MFSTFLAKLGIKGFASQPGDSSANKVVIFNADGQLDQTMIQSNLIDHTDLMNVGTHTHSQIDSHINSASNPHSVTKTQVGLGNVDNTSDVNKPVSTATQTALELKTDLTSFNAHATNAALHLTDSQDTLLDNLTATHTELNYSVGVTSSIQTQIDSKASGSTVSSHISNTSNPHSVTKTQVGLGNCDNTSDINKPVSTATQTALDLKADGSALTSHTSNTANPHSVTKTQVGLGNCDNTSDIGKPVSTATQTALDLKATVSSLTTHTSDTANPHSVTKTQVGLGNCDNTSDANKPISTATQTALDLKATVSSLTTHTSDTANPHSVTKTQVGLGNCDNTSDANKPISTATQTALDLKAAASTLTAHTSDTANPHSVTKTQVGLGNCDNTSDANKPISTATQTALDLKATVSSLTTHTSDTANPHNVTKTQVGLGNCDNTSDANKPISTATQTALDLKATVSSLTTHTSDTANPHSVTKTQVGLGNCDNTSDANKPISTATQTALDLKADGTALTSHTLNTFNPHNVTKTQVGLGNCDNTSDANKPISTATQTALDLKAAASTLTAHTSDTANPHSVTKTQVGLGNCDNTSDANKPISTATQTALDLKQAEDDELTKYNKQATNIASAATVDLGTATGAFVQITGNAAISSFGTAAAGVTRRVRFTSNPSVAHDGTNIIMPTGASQVMSAGDMFTAISTGTGWRITTFDRASAELEKYCNGAVSAASGTAYAIGAATSDLILVTGTNNISSITGGVTGMSRTLVFNSVLTLVHGSNLLLPGAANITTASGDIAIFRATSSVTWRCVQYLPANGLPFLHASTHKSGGTDAIKLDELAAPTDVTTLNSTTSTHGLLCKLDGTTTNFLRGDGAWALPTVTSVNTQTGDVVISKASLSLENVDNTSDIDKPISTATQTALDLKANLTDVVGLLDLKSSIDASASPNYPAALKGDSMFISVAGRVGGVSGTVVEVGDLLIAVSDNAGGDQATVGSSWSILQNNIQGLTTDGLALIQSDYATMRSLLSLVVGTNVQAYRVELGKLGLTDSIASASTVSLYNAVGDTVTITGTATITSFGTSATSGAYRKLIFSSSGAILTYNASTLVLPGSANITVQAGDTAQFVSTSFNKWVCVSYQRGNGNPLTGGGTLWNNYRDEVDKIASGISTVSSASTTNIGAPSTDQMYISGTSTINTLSGGVSGMRRKLYFTSSGGTLSSGAVALPGSVSVTWAAGDSAEVVYTGSSPAWKCTSYFKANGKAFVAPEAGTDFNAYRGELDIINTASGIAAASTMEIQGVSGDYLAVYGSASITSLGYGASPYGSSRVLVFDESSSVLVNSSAIILPGAADITVAAGDVAIFRQLASDVWKCTSYTRADGTALAATAKATDSEAVTGTDNNKFVTPQGVTAAKAVLPITTVSVSAGSLTLGMAGNLVNLDFSSDGTIVIPPNSSVAFYVGTQIVFRQANTGKGTITPDTGVTINSVTGTFQTLGQHALCTLIKVGTDEWVLGGALTP